MFHQVITLITLSQVTLDKVSIVVSASEI